MIFRGICGLAFLAAPVLLGENSERPRGRFQTEVMSLSIKPAQERMRRGVIKMDRDLDWQKPRAPADFAGWVYSNELLWGGADDASLIAYHFKTEKRMFSLPLIGGLTVPLFFSSGRVIAADRSGNIYCINEENGTIVWKALLDSFVARPMLKEGSHLVLVTAFQSLYRIDFETGQITWVFNGEKPDGLIANGLAAPAIVNGIAYYGWHSGEILAVKMADGALRWRSIPQVGSSEFKDYIGAIVYRGGRLILTRYDGYVFSIDPQLPDHSEAVWAKSEEMGNISSSAVRENRLFVGTTSGRVLCFDTLRGQKLWEAYASKAVQLLSPGESNLYVSTSGGLILTLNAQNGDIRWFDELGSTVNAPPFYMQGKIYFATGLRNLYGYDYL